MEVLEHRLLSTGSTGVSQVHLELMTRLFATSNYCSPAVYMCVEGVAPPPVEVVNERMSLVGGGASSAFGHTYPGVQLHRCTVHMESPCGS